jgi:hypothetical protein
MPKTTRQANRTVARKPAAKEAAPKVAAAPVKAPSVPAKAAATPAKAAAPKAAATKPAAALSSSIHFHIHPGIPEILGYAQGRGWLANGWVVGSVPWYEVVFTTDHWKTTSHQKSTVAPDAAAHGKVVLEGVAPGTEIEFALNVGVACRAAADEKAPREQGDVWLNNAGANFRQTTH